MTREQKNELSVMVRARARQAVEAHLRKRFPIPYAAHDIAEAVKRDVDERFEARKGPRVSIWGYDHA